MEHAGWLEALYDEAMADLFLARIDEDDIEFLHQRLHLQLGSTVFDQCCGLGTVGLSLARRGARVVGVDLMSAYVERAGAAAAAEDLPCEFHQADAAVFAPRRPCDAAFNWRTGLGYGDDAHSLAMLQRAFHALRPGGWFALDYQNVPAVLRRFQGALVRRAPTPQGELVLLRESTLHLDRGTLEQRWTYFLPDGRRRLRESSVRLYMPHVLCDFLRSCGFADIALFGDAAGGPLTADSPRCICLARRP